MGEAFRNTVQFISIWAIPTLLFLIPVAGIVKKVKVYECFVVGAKEGFNVEIGIIPYLVAILFAF